MHCACAQEHLEAVEALIGLGANIDAQDNYGNTPLHVATRTRHIGIVQLLLKAGANTELTDAVNRIVLRPNYYNGFIVMMNVLIKTKEQSL